MEETVVPLRLKLEVVRLLPPYVALGFDQRMIARSRAEKVALMGEFQIIEHLSQYGRPLYVALIRQGRLLTFELSGVRNYLKNARARWSPYPP